MLGDASSSSSSTNDATQDSNPISSEPIEKTIPLSARKLRADSITLLKSLKELRSLNPLGESLDSIPNNNNDDGEDDGDGKNNVPWTNREDYIKWNSNKVTANLVTERKDRDRNGNGKDPSSDDYSSGVPSSSSGVRKSIGSKRGRMNEDDEQDLRRKKVGKLEDLEVSIHRMFQLCDLENFLLIANNHFYPSSFTRISFSQSLSAKLSNQN